MHVSYQVRQLERHLAEVAKATRQEEAVIRLLGVEWDALNDPGWVDGLAVRHDLSLASTPIQRVVTLESIPLKPADALPGKPAAEIAGKTMKDRGPEKAPNPPAMQARSIPLVRLAKHEAPPAPDDVGLLLARVERRE